MDVESVVVRDSIRVTTDLFIPQMDTGFIMWSFQGNVLYRNPIQIEKFCQLLWRPRPPTLLTKEDQQVCGMVTMGW